MIDFDFAGSNKDISIVQQFTKNTWQGEETVFETLYKIRIQNTTLRELMLIQSMYLTESTNEILKLVKIQPSPMIFFKSLMEFSGANLISMLSFDSKSIKELLDDKNEKYF